MRCNAAKPHRWPYQPSSSCRWSSMYTLQSNIYDTFLATEIFTLAFTFLREIMVKVFYWEKEVINKHTMQLLLTTHNRKFHSLLFQFWSLLKSFINKHLLISTKTNQPCGKELTLILSTFIVWSTQGFFIFIGKLHMCPMGLEPTTSLST